ncbi:MAG: PatB family C-S lyase [Prevotellaceae bacterium]|jgi:cystathionine beta-lyase|nr:PatB family C-S lyase [Prevotellaceae bacterium]
MYHFDEIIDRSNTDAIKLKYRKDIFGTDDVLPLWVADMDFRTPDFILNAIAERLKHPVLGYTAVPDNFQSVIADWVYRHHNLKVAENAIGFLPGIVPGLAFAVQAFTEKGDEIIVQPPVYYPFMNVVIKNRRKVVYNPLVKKDNLFQMDFEDLEQKITDKTKLLILCNPHNPGGRVWDEDSLKKLAEICTRHNIPVISDEIHADMTFEQYTHTPFANTSEEAANISVTYMAPSKTFNMPGLIASYYIIPNEKLRNKLDTFLDKNELRGGNIFAYEATLAAYTQGEEWRRQMLGYVQKNIDDVVAYLQENIPEIAPMIPQASFLVWLDCSRLGFASDDKLVDFFVSKAKLGFNRGTMFGPGGENHLRMNVACSRTIIKEALNRLHTALK